MRRGTLRRLAALVGVVAIAALLCLRLQLLSTRLYDPDEFEHLHASLSIAKGEVPYRDFFEHHGPLPYYLAAPLAAWMGPAPELLTANRLLGFACLLVLLAGVVRLSRLLFGGWSGTLALLWLLTLSPFVEKSVEWRPDVPAASLLAWSFAVIAVPGAVTWRRAAGFGALVALATLCTPKIVFLAGGAVVGVAVVVGPRSALRVAAWTALLGLAAWGAAAALFRAADAGTEFLRCTLWLPITWQTSGEDAIVLARSLWAPGHFLVAGAALAASLSLVSTQRGRRRRELFLAFACLAHLAATPLVAAVYLQYFLPLFPILAVLCGGWLRRAWKVRRRLPWIGLVPAAILVQTVEGWLGWPRLARFGRLVFEERRGWIESGLVEPNATVILLGFAFFLAGMCVAFLPRGKQAGVVVMLIGLWIPSLGRSLAPHLYWRRDGQIKDIELVRRAAGPRGAVLDGFSGLGCLQPHAFYWTWINEHSGPLLVREGDLAKLVDLVRRGEPAVILYDRHLHQFGEALVPLVERGYRPIGRRPLSRGVAILLRRDLPDPTANDTDPSARRVAPAGAPP